MKKSLKCKKGKILIILPIYLTAISIILAIIYKIITINLTKTYIYPYKFSYTERLEENEFNLVNDYIQKIDKTNITSTEELKSYLKNNNIVESLESSKIYYDKNKDCISIERNRGGVIENVLEYEFQNGEIILKLKHY